MGAEEDFGTAKESECGVSHWQAIMRVSASLRQRGSACPAHIVKMIEGLSYLETRLCLEILVDRGFAVTSKSGRYYWVRPRSLTR
jgi:hypothetical protein